LVKRGVRGLSKAHDYDGEKQLVFCVLTTSDTRSIIDDEGGATIREKLMSAGHKVFESRICQDDKQEIEAVIEEWFENPDVHGIITTGGTGLGFRDVTVETLGPYFTKEIEGFGELFRMISYGDVGSKSMLSRAGAGIVDEKIVFMLPGSVKAVDLAMEKLVIPELHHIIYEITKHLDNS